MKTQLQRLNNISGQIEGIKKMYEKGSDCVNIMTQLKAVKSAINGIMDQIFEEQFQRCVKSAKVEDKKLLIKVKKYVENN
jgi:DNA-binding FrmR family transcriptional regulator